MQRIEAINLILQVTKENRPFDALELRLKDISKAELSSSLLECGVIPELLEHDSSEEKLWSKYCDILLAQVWNQLKIRAEVLRTRGDSADVFGKADTYTIIGDAKAFRLSRTAKNQKDFKVKALDDWRKGNTYACLVSPLYQYPSRTSQIYEQALERNVTLLSYIHLKFLLDHYAHQDLAPLWNISGSLAKTKSAATYWEAVDHLVCQLVRLDENDLNQYKAEEINRTRKIGEEGIGFWEQKRRFYQQLPQQEAVERLIRSEKIEAKIQTIRSAVNSLPVL